MTNQQMKEMAYKAFDHHATGLWRQGKLAQSDANYVRVLTKKDISIGYILYHHTGHSSIELECVFIDPDHRGEGHMYKLMDTVSEFKEIRLMTSMTLIPLFKKLGFVRTSQKSKHAMFQMKKTNPNATPYVIHALKPTPVEDFMTSKEQIELQNSMKD